MSFISLNSYSNPINIDGGGNTGNVSLSGNNVFTGNNEFTNPLTCDSITGLNTITFEDTTQQTTAFIANTYVLLTENNVISGNNEFTNPLTCDSITGLNTITFEDTTQQTTAFTSDTYVLLSENNVISGNNTFSGSNTFENAIYCTDIGSITSGGGAIGGFASFTFSDETVQTTAYLGPQNSWVGYVSINQNAQPFTTIATAKNDPQIVNFNVPTPTGLQPGTYIIDWGFYITYTNSITGNSDFSLFCTNVWLASNIQIPSANFYNTYFCQFRQEIDILSPVDSTIPIGLSIFDLTTGAGYSINYMVATIITKAT